MLVGPSLILSSNAASDVSATQADQFVTNNGALYMYVPNGSSYKTILPISPKVSSLVLYRIDDKNNANKTELKYDGSSTYVVYVGKEGIIPYNATASSYAILHLNRNGDTIAKTQFTIFWSEGLKKYIALKGDIVTETQSVTTAVDTKPIVTTTTPVTTTTTSTTATTATTTPVTTTANTTAVTTKTTVTPVTVTAPSLTKAIIPANTSTTSTSTKTTATTTATDTAITARAMAAAPSTEATIVDQITANFVPIEDTLSTIQAPESASINDVLSYFQNMFSSLFDVVNTNLQSLLNGMAFQAQQNDILEQRLSAIEDIIGKNVTIKSSIKKAFINNAQNLNQEYDQNMADFQQGLSDLGGTSAGKAALHGAATNNVGR